MIQPVIQSISSFWLLNEAIKRRMSQLTTQIAFRSVFSAFIGRWWLWNDFYYCWIWILLFSLKFYNFVILRAIFSWFDSPFWYFKWFNQTNFRLQGPRALRLAVKPWTFNKIPSFNCHALFRAINCLISSKSRLKSKFLVSTQKAQKQQNLKKWKFPTNRPARLFIFIFSRKSQITYVDRAVIGDRPIRSRKARLLQCQLFTALASIWWTRKTPQKPRFVNEKDFHNAEAPFFHRRHGLKW